MCNTFTQVAASGHEQSRATDAAGHTDGGGIGLRATNGDALSPVSWWGSVLRVWEMFYCLTFLIIWEVFLRVAVYSWLQQTTEVKVMWEMAPESINFRQVEFKSDCFYITKNTRLGEKTFGRRII